MKYNLARQYTYDAAGRTISVAAGTPAQFFDGDGRRVKTTELSVATYYVRSTVLDGEVIAELDGSGSKTRGFVYVSGKVLAEEFQNGFVALVHEEPSGVSVRKTGSVTGVTYELFELDAFKANAELIDPYVEDPDYSGRGEGGPVYPSYGNVTDPSRGCTVQGIFSLCDLHTGGGAIPLWFWGSDIANLPGFGTEWGSFAALAEWEYERRLAYTRARVYGVRRSREGSPRGTDPGWAFYFVPQPQNTAPNENGIREGLKKALSNPDCQKLVDALLNAVATKKNPLVSQYGQGGIMGMFEAVMLEDGLTRTPVPGSAGYGSATGNIAQGNAQIFVESRPFGPADQLQADVKGVLAELMHLAGQKASYTDRAFADIVHRDYPKLTTSIWPDDKSYKFRKDALKNDNHIGWSYYWHYAVNRTCF